MAFLFLTLPSELHRQAVNAAADVGIGTHAFVVGAIRQALEAVQQRAEFVAQAQSALAEMLETGLGYDADHVRNYLRERQTDPHASRPEPTSWRT